MFSLLYRLNFRGQQYKSDHHTAVHLYSSSNLSIFLPEISLLFMSDANFRGQRTHNLSGYRVFPKALVINFSEVPSFAGRW